LTSTRVPRPRQSETRSTARAHNAAPSKSFSRSWIAPIPAEGPSPPTHPAVTRVSSNHVEVSPDALESLGALGVRAIPYMERGALAGVRLYGVRRTSPLAAAGVQNGDVIRAVDGQPLGSPDVALAALGRLRGGSPVRVTLVRGGEAREMTLSLR